MYYKSRPVPVKAIQWNKDGDYSLVRQVSGNRYELSLEYGATEVEPTDWIVEFPNGEIHVVRDIHFKIRFEHVETFTPKEISYARLLADMGDCV